MSDYLDKYKELDGNHSKQLRQSAGIDDDIEGPLLKINRFKRKEQTDFLVSGIHYVFFTRPQLNLKQNINFDPFLKKMSTTTLGKRLIDILNYREASITSPFINLLTNSATNFPTKDVVLEVMESGQNSYGSKLKMGGTIFESLGSDSISITYEEYQDMEITFLHKLWVEYINNVKFGKFSPLRETIEEMILDYVSSIYYFLVGPDGHTIKYYAKYTGLFPTNIPYSALSAESDNMTLRKLSVNYDYTYKEDLNPRIITDFNLLSGLKSSGKNEIPKYHLKNSWFDTSFVEETSDGFSLRFSSASGAAPSMDDPVVVGSFNKEKTSQNTSTKNPTPGKSFSMEVDPDLQAEMDAETAKMQQLVKENQALERQAQGYIA